MNLFRKRTLVAERMIRLQRLPPDHEPIEETIAVSELLGRDSLFRPSDWTGGNPPPLEEINRFLTQGSGDDGHFVHRWAPFELTAEEYKHSLRRLRRRRTGNVGAK